MVSAVAEVGYKTDTSGLKDADKALTTTTKNSTKLSDVIDRTVKSFKVQKNAVQVASYQIQDFAVQVGSGQSAMTAFTQQAPQFFGVFGAGGAVLGTVVAITAAVAGPLITSLFDAKDASEELDEALTKLEKVLSTVGFNTLELSDSFKELKDQASSYSKIKVNEAIAGLDDAAKKSVESIKELGEEYDLAKVKIQTRSFTGGFVTQLLDSSKALSESLKITQEDAKSFSNAYNTFIGKSSVESAQNLLDVISGVQDANKDSTNTFYTQTGAIADLVKQYIDLKNAKQEAVAPVSQEEDPFLTYEVDPISGFDDRYEKAKAYYDRMDKLRQREADNDAKAAENKKKMEQAAIVGTANFYAQSLSIIADGQKEGSQLRRAAVAAQKVAAITQMIIATENAATQALTVPYVGFALSQATRAVGYASVGVVAGQSIASFDGGGFTGSGSRSGGVDGKGGFHAILHPNETVVDHTKGQGMSPKIEVYNYSGQQASAITEGDVVKIIVGQMGNQQSPARQALQTSSNVSSRGMR